MTRHSKNNCSGAVFTYAERQKLQYGTQKQRLGKDSLAQWDSCGLCLQGLARSPKGHMFCKECIYQALLAQKQENKKRITEWEQNEQRKKDDERAKLSAAEAQQIEQFEKIDGAILPARALIVVGDTAKPIATPLHVTSDGKEVRLDTEYQLLEDKRAQAQLLSARMRKAEMERGLKSNFWMPSNTPTAAEAALPRPSEETSCTGGHPLRLKALIRVHLSSPLTPTPANDNVAVYEPGRYECPVCKRTLANSMKPVVLSECGHTVCTACLNNYVIKERKCFVCTKPCREKDVIRVAESATGYAAHGDKLEASKHTPTAWL